MFALLLSCLLALPCVTVAGDSVVVTVTVLPEASQPVSVDSIRAAIAINDGGALVAVDTQTKAATGAAVEFRFAYPLAWWTEPGMTKVGRIGAAYGRTVSGGCPGQPGGSACWSAFTYSGDGTENGGWQYTNDAQAPNAPTSDEFEVTSVELN